ncbi:hypothetical protein FBF48_10365 [Streptococcus salivarius]|uniref:Uncharacterized protein n=1 Tax=Streptococcus salivarius TaxID=1304 RepID=A0AAX2UZ52_STRSL|nr:hypothetical protein [Streptococcus salivarius]TNF65666.1 hypothetical protein FBF48_10365 [Streptococcus salivarius]
MSESHYQIPAPPAPLPPWEMQQSEKMMLLKQAKQWVEDTAKLNAGRMMLGHQTLTIDVKGAEPRVVSREDLLAALALLDEQKPQPEPFDLERAKAGDPIITRDGRKVRFLAHVPEAQLVGCMVVVMIEGDERPSFYAENGCFHSKAIVPADLLMAPEEKPVDAPMWAVTYHRETKGQVGYVYAHEEDARRISADLQGVYRGVRMIKVKEC